MADSVLNSEVGPKNPDRDQSPPRGATAGRVAKNLYLLTPNPKP